MCNKKTMTLDLIIVGFLGAKRCQIKVEKRTRNKKYK